MKIRLLGKTPTELREIALSCGLPAYAGGQIAQWLYRKRVASISEMTNLSKAGRAALGERCEVGRSAPVAVQESSDGTRKYLFSVTAPLGAGADRMEAPDPGPVEVRLVEAVMIPEADRRTLCVSSQAGCKMGCTFCATGHGGFHGNLGTADILNQFLSIEEAADLTNAVFMGMGEPLDNYPNVARALDVLTSDWGFGWSPKRVTLSTIGVLPSLGRFLEESRCHLAVSLHNPFPEERSGIMPVQRAYPLSEVLSLVRRHDFSGQRRVSFEYTLFEGLNDTPRHAKALASLLRGIPCRVNLIRFHETGFFPHRSSSPSAIEAFQRMLVDRGVNCTVRASRGEDIDAACGLLAGRGATPGGPGSNQDD